MLAATGNDPLPSLHGSSRTALQGPRLSPMVASERPISHSLPRSHGSSRAALQQRPEAVSHGQL